MNQRERFKRFVISFPICKTAFVASTLKKEWATKVSHKEVRDVFLECGCLPSVVLGEKEWLSIILTNLHSDRLKKLIKNPAMNWRFLHIFTHYSHITLCFGRIYD